MQDKHIMYQVSTLQALLLGYSRSVITVKDLLEQGDTGLGTFEDVNGEMIVADGHCYQADDQGNVTEAAPDMGVPFASVTKLDADRSFCLKDIPNINTLTTELTLRVEEGFGLNSMHMVFIRGFFRKISARSESPFRSHHVELKEILEQTQKDFFFENLPGSLICVYYPDFMDGINAAGWHFHFLSDDHTKGGHVFGVDMAEGDALMERIYRIEINLPTSPAFDTYSLKDFDQDDVKKVEQGTE